MKKSSRVISTLLLGATLTTLSANVFAVESKETIEKKLLAGNNRYETAVKVSEKWEKADNVVLVNALAMADALAATPLAKLKDAPILLTDAGELTKATKERIEKLGAKNVFVVGGEGVVSKAVVAELEKAGLKVERISGVDRFETSAKVAKELDAKKVAVVNGLNGRLADALSVAAPAAENNMAILLTNGKDLGAVKDAAKDKEAVVVGGSAVVADSIKSDLKAERLGGANRNETNAEVMKKFYGDKQVKSVYVAKDGAAQENQLVDALAAGPVAGKEGAPIVLAGSKLADGQKKFLEGQGAVATVYEVGGGINTSTVKDLMTALGVKDVVDKAEVSSVKATNLKEVVVTFGMKVDADSAQDTENYSINKGIEIEDATLQEDGRTVVLDIKEKDNKVLNNQEKYKLTVDKVLAGDKEIETKDFEFTPMDNAYPEVKEVVNLGTKAIKVVFSEPVKKANSNDFKLDGKTLSASVDNNGNELILTPYEKNSLKPGEYKLSVEGVEDYAGFKSLPSEHKFTVVEDKTAPKVEKVDATLERVRLTFSEDVDPATVKASNVYYKTGDRKVKSDRYKKINGKTYEFYFEGDNRLPGYEMTLYVEDVKDYSENKITETAIKVTPVVDQERPKVKSVSVNAGKTIVTVKFSKNIHEDSKNPKYFTIKDEDGKVIGVKEVKYADGDEKKTLKLELYKELPAGKNTIKIDGVKDNTHLQNVMLPYEGVINAADTEAPERVAYSVSEKDRTVIITFDKKMDGSTLTNLNNYTIKFNDGVKTYTRALPSDTDPTVIQDGKGIKLVLPKYIDKDTLVEFNTNVLELNYMGLKDEAGNIIDTYSGTIPLKEVEGMLAERYSSSIGNAAVAEDRKTIKVKFNQGIRKASKNSFKLSNPKAEIDEVITDNTSVVTIKLKEKLESTSTKDLKVILNKEEGKETVVGMETSAGSKVVAMRAQGKDEDKKDKDPIKESEVVIEDKIAPEVTTDANGTYEVRNGDTIIIPFTEDLSESKTFYATDLKIIPLSGDGTALLASDFEVNVVKNELQITITKATKVATKYKVTLKEDKDKEGKVAQIQDGNGNKALAKDEILTRDFIKVASKEEKIEAAEETLTNAKSALDNAIQVAKNAINENSEVVKAEKLAVTNAQKALEEAMKTASVTEETDPAVATEKQAVVDAQAALNQAIKVAKDAINENSEVVKAEKLAVTNAQAALDALKNK